MKLVQETFDYAANLMFSKPDWTWSQTACTLVVDGKSAAFTLPAVTNASPTVAAKTVADAINAANISFNGYKAKATSSDAILAILSVENEDTSGPARIDGPMISGGGGSSGWPATDSTKWSFNDIETPFVDPTAGTVSPATMRSNVIAAMAAGAIASRLVK